MHYAGHPCMSPSPFSLGTLALCCLYPPQYPTVCISGVSPKHPHIWESEASVMTGRTAAAHWGHYTKDMCNGCLYTR